MSISNKESEMDMLEKRPLNLTASDKNPGQKFLEYEGRKNKYKISTNWVSDNYKVGYKSSIVFPTGKGKTRAFWGYSSVSKQIVSPATEFEEEREEMDPRDEKLFDAKIEASEARSNVKISELRGEIREFRAEISGKFDLIVEKMDSVNNKISETQESIVKENQETRRVDTQNKNWIIGLIITIFAVSFTIISIIVAIFFKSLNLGKELQLTVDTVKMMKTPSQNIGASKIPHTTTKNEGEKKKSPLIPPTPSK